MSDEQKCVCKDEVVHLKTSCKYLFRTNLERIKNLQGKRTSMGYPVNNPEVVEVRGD